VSCIAGAGKLEEGQDQIGEGTKIMIRCVSTGNQLWAIPSWCSWFGKPTQTRTGAGPFDALVSSAFRQYS
jgi:hypothetical protein